MHDAILASVRWYALMYTLPFIFIGVLSSQKNLLDDHHDFEKSARNQNLDVLEETDLNPPAH